MIAELLGRVRAAVAKLPADQRAQVESIAPEVSSSLICTALHLLEVTAAADV